MHTFSCSVVDKIPHCLLRSCRHLFQHMQNSISFTLVPTPFIECIQNMITVFSSKHRPALGKFVGRMVPFQLALRLSGAEFSGGTTLKFDRSCISSHCSNIEHCSSLHVKLPCWTIFCSFLLTSLFSTDCFLLSNFLNYKDDVCPLV